MKPLRLEFQGINSFSEHTIIDFEALTRGGIFGIFGDTGSGKSTVLDCINFALYGNVERSKEKTDIINYNSEKAEVKFVFDILNCGKRKRYTAERLLKKDKSGTHKAMLYEYDGEKEICIADKSSQVEKKIVEILGVEAEDFRKCIALPQGEFSQFVKSVPSERLKLIERLFGLGKYGDRLKDKLSSRQNKNEGDYQLFSGKLQAYENVTQELLEETIKNQEEQKILLEQKRTEEKRINQNYERLKILNEKLLELEKLKSELAGLEKTKPQIEELRSGISLLSSCREAVAIADEKDKKQSEIAALRADKEALQKRLDADISSVYAIENKIKENNFDEKISECVELAAKYSSCSGKPEKLNSILSELEKRRLDYKRLEEEKQKLLAVKKETEEQTAKIKKELEDCSAKDIMRLIGVEFKGAVLKEEYAANLDYFANFYGNVKIFEEDAPLYNYVSGELKLKLDEYKQRLVDVRDFKTEAIFKQLENLQNADKEREEKSKLYNNANARLQKLIADITVKQNEIETALKDGKDLRQRADELSEELKLVFGEDNKDYQKVLNANAQKLSDLRAEKLSLSSKLEALNVSKNSLIVSKERLEGLLLAAQSEYLNLDKKLENAIKENQLKSIENCRALFEKFKDVNDAENEVSKFETQFAALSSRKKEFEKSEDIFTATKEVLDASEREKSAIYAMVSEISNKLAVLESERKSIEKRLKEKSEILKDFAVVQKERNLLAQLKEITKGNKFLEYIANEYLSDISALASSTLLNLTGGRYFLVYKQNNFAVGDNFNCGNLRGVNTLSGGETFLVSLSLALALSQTICSKSMKSIEFFFLDEGFGTLDGTLVDTVMNALEKLKSSSFTIGVISHVEELKYRIANKIIVNKATENHGSTVTVSC